MSDLYKNNGDYNLHRCVLIIGENESKTEIDISNVFQDVTIYESIHSSFMSGSVVLTDNLNLLDFATLGYGEKILIEFSTAGIENKTVFEGTVYSVSEPYRATEHTTLYTLYFASYSSIFAKRTRHWTAHKEKTMSEIVKAVFEETAQYAWADNKKPLEVTDTETRRYILFTGHDTVEAVKLCAKYARSTNDECGFVFYENSKSFCFKPLEQLMKQEPVMEYFLSQKGAYSGNGQTTNQEAVKSGFEESFNNYQDLIFEKNKTHLESIIDGSLGMTYNFVSIRDRYNQKVTSDVGKHVNKKLSDNPYMANYVELDNEGKIVVIPQIQLFGDEETVVRNDAVLKRCNNISINIATFGNSELKVGDVVKANIPRWSTNMGEEDSVDRYSGNYLVAEIKHVLNRNAYNTRLKIIRDGINGEPIEVVDQSKVYNEDEDQEALEQGANENVENENAISEDKKYTIKAVGAMQGSRGAFGTMHVYENNSVIFSIPFRSGSSAGRGIYSIWNGNFRCNNYSNRRTGAGRYNKAMNIGDVGFSFDLNPVDKQSVWRGDLRIHPDGGSTIGNGSAGCIAVNGNRQSLLKCESLLRDIINKQKFIPVHINITGNPNNKTKHAGNE